MNTQSLSQMPAASKALFSILIFSCHMALADDWPRWLGAKFDGLSHEKGLLQEWPEDGPPVKWLASDLGQGYSAPAVEGDFLYVMGTEGKAEHLFCLNSRTGERVWSAKMSKIYKSEFGNGPRGTPTIDGDYVYALSAKGALVCVDKHSGKRQWKLSLLDHGGVVAQFGYSESPLVDGDIVVVTPGGAGGVVALDKKTGDLIWQTTELDDITQYSSVVIANFYGKKQYLQLFMHRLVSLDPASGEVLWAVDWPGRLAVVPTPMVSGNYIYLTTGYGVGCMLVEVLEEGDTNVVYSNKKMKNHHGGVLILDGYVYGYSDKIGWVCQDLMTGKQVWRERKELGKGAIAHSENRFYCVDEETGEVALIEASPEGWKEHGRFTMSPQSENRQPNGAIWMHPVIANGRMYLRDQEYLFCFDISTNSDTQAKVNTDRVNNPYGLSDQQIDWMKEAAVKQLEGCRVEGDDGTWLHTPDGVGNYAALWTRDFYYMIQYAGDLLDADEIKSSLEYLLAGQREDGCIPDRVNERGKPIYSPGGPDNQLADHALDNGAFMALAVCAYVEQHEDLDFFKQVEPKILSGLNQISLSADGLVYSDPSDPQCVYGFTDIVKKTGQVLFCSIVYYEACDRMANLCERSECGDPFEYRSRAALIKENMNALWNAQEGMFMAADGDCNQIDIWGSALAVNLKLTSDDQAGRIAEYLVQNRQGLFYRGHLRHLAPANQEWECLWEDCEPGTYQNGAYWATPLAWVIPVCAQHNKEFANQITQEVISDFMKNGINECINKQYTKVPNFVVSATNVYSLCR